MDSFATIYRWLSEQPRHRTGLRVLQCAIGCMLLFRIATEWRFAQYLWGPDGVGVGSMVPVFGSALGGKLDLIFRHEGTVYVVLLALALSAIALVVGAHPRLACIGACLSFKVLELRCLYLPDGGDNITGLVLVYMILTMSHDNKWVRASTAVWLHNIGVAAIVAQLMVMYTTAGLTKVMGASWQAGTSMYFISQVDNFSLPSLRRMFRNPAVVVLSSYAPIFFQVWFAPAIVSRLRIVWLVVGIGFHIGIAFLMGLLTFSTVMIGLELFLVTDREYDALVARIRIVIDVGARFRARASAYFTATR